MFTTLPECLQILRYRVCDELDNLRQNLGMVRGAVRAMQRRSIFVLRKKVGTLEGELDDIICL